MNGLLRALRLFARPLSRTADQLSLLNRNIERYFAHTRIPDLPAESDVERHASERAVPPSREEWELAIDEELEARKAASDREIV